MNNERAFIRITGPAMFWLFMLAIVAAATYIWVTNPPSIVTQMLNQTKEERALRNLQDPLAMRLYVCSQMFGDASRDRLMTKIVEQWASEVTDLKDRAYHTKAAEPWSIDTLDIPAEQKAQLKVIWANSNKPPQ
jgi:hypothetical protein